MKAMPRGRIQFSVSMQLRVSRSPRKVNKNKQVKINRSIAFWTPHDARRTLRNRVPDCSAACSQCATPLEESAEHRVPDYSRQYLQNSAFFYKCFLLLHEIAFSVSQIILSNLAHRPIKFWWFCIFPLHQSINGNSKVNLEEEIFQFSRCRGNQYWRLACFCSKESML